MKPFSRQDWLGLMSKVDITKVERIEESLFRYGTINIRHDIDDDLQASLDMAREEQKIGIRSTYFFLNTARYWRDMKELERAVKEIASLGHEIGWHNNALSDHLRTGKPLRQCIEEPLTLLRHWAEVYGSASHGDPFCYDYKYLNYYVFSEIPINEKFTPAIKFDRFEMKEFGLIYEAYFTGHNLYISESGGTWHQNNDEVLSWFNEPDDKLQILLHPQWWQL